MKRGLSSQPLSYCQKRERMGNHVRHTRIQITQLANWCMHFSSFKIDQAKRQVPGLLLCWPGPGTASHCVTAQSFHFSIHNVSGHSQMTLQSLPPLRLHERTTILCGNSTRGLRHSCKEMHADSLRLFFTIEVQVPRQP